MANQFGKDEALKRWDDEKACKKCNRRTVHTNMQFVDRDVSSCNECGSTTTTRYKKTFDEGLGRKVWKVVETIFKPKERPAPPPKKMGRPSKEDLEWRGEDNDN